MAELEKLDSGLNIEKIATENDFIAVINSDTMLITDAQSALDLLMTVNYEVGTKYIVIPKRLVCDEFFILSTGVAGEILQKYINYGAKLAIYGDYSHYTSKPLKDFMYESNKGKDVFFSETREEAVERLKAEVTK